MNRSNCFNSIRIFYFLLLVESLSACIPTNQPDFPDFETTSSTTTTTTTTLTCPNSFYTLGPGGLCYRYRMAVINEATAKMKCQQDLGGMLASVHNADENNFIANLVMGAQIWLGIERTNPETICPGADHSACFKTIDDGNPLTYQNWRPTQTFLSTEMCVTMNQATPLSTWDDSDCSEMHTFVCTIQAT